MIIFASEFVKSNKHHTNTIIIMNDNKIMNKAADNIRILAASMVEKAKSGHPGGAMGGADFINTLYSEFLVYDPENPAWEARDRFFLDPGHMAPMLYSQLCLIGKFTLEDLQQLRQWGSVTPGHPEREIERGIENTSGPLGQGHTFAVGAAIAAKFLKARLGDVMGQTIYAYISDGGVQEEISQGAGRIAGNLGLDNLIMFYDANDIQLSTKTEVVTSEDTAKKYEAWGWYVQKINGNDVDQIREAIKNAQKEQHRPSIIIGHCVMGKGALKADGSSYEKNCATHGAPLGGDAYINTIKNLGGDPEKPFQIFPEVQELYAKRREELKKIVAERKAQKAEWAKANPEKARQMEEWFSGKAPKIDWSKVEQKPGSATRSASAAVLGQLAEQVPNMICASADLSNSDNTNGFLKKTHDMERGDSASDLRPDGVRVRFVLALPKGYAGPPLRHARVTLLDPRYGMDLSETDGWRTALAVSGDPHPTIPCPTRWDTLVEVGRTDNSFEVTILRNEYETIPDGARIYIPGTEYGGIFRRMETNTSHDTICPGGRTWRGMMQKKIICPESGQDYATDSGELNAIVKERVEEAFPGLFGSSVPKTK